MLRWPIALLAVALLAAIAGFGEVVEPAGPAQALFLLCIAGFVALMLRSAGRAR